MSYPPDMREIPFVKKDEAEFAREIERRLLDVREDAGILFVGVSVKPTKAGEEPIYHVWIGCHRDTREDLMPRIVDNMFCNELAAGTRIQVEAHRGLVRS
jgi:hypothetical protein